MKYLKCQTGYTINHKQMFAAELENFQQMKSNPIRTFPTNPIKLFELNGVMLNNVRIEHRYVMKYDTDHKIWMTNYSVNLSVQTGNICFLMNDETASRIPITLPQRI